MVATGGKQKGDDIGKKLLCNITWYRYNEMSAQLLDVSLSGVGTVFCLERDVWSMFKRLEGQQQIIAPPLPPPCLGLENGEWGVGFSFCSHLCRHRGLITST